MLVFLLFRVVLAVWVVGIICLILYKISTNSLKSMHVLVLLLFPILLLTRKGRERIKGELK